MELSLTTFILEIINFLVLVWILKRLFYAPVKRAIENRKAAVSKTLSDAHHAQGDAEKLRAQYERRLEDWENEKANARKELEQQLSQERERRLKQMDAAIEAERKKLHAQQEKKTAEERSGIERRAIKQSLSFTSRLLSALASPELEAKLVELVLKRMKEKQTDNSELSSKSLSAPYRVITAFELSEAQKKALRSALGASDSQAEFKVDNALMAGIEIEKGATVVRANLRDELSYFSEMSV